MARTPIMRPPGSFPGVGCSPGTAKRRSPLSSPREHRAHKPEVPTTRHLCTQGSKNVATGPIVSRTVKDRARRCPRSGRPWLTPPTVRASLSFLPHCSSPPHSRGASRRSRRAPRAPRTSLLNRSASNWR